MVKYDSDTTNQGRSVLYTVNFSLDTTSKIKLYHQLYTKLSDAIESGEISTGTKIPSVRTLSDTLKVSRNTITRAYQELEDSGYLYSLPKSGFYAKRPDESAPVPKKSVPAKSEPSAAEEDSVPTVESIVRQRKKASVPADFTEDTLRPEEMGHSIIDAMIAEPEPQKSAPKNEATSATTEQHKGVENNASELLKESHENIRRHAKVFTAMQHNSSSAKSFELALLDSYRVALTEKSYLLRKASGTFGDEQFRVALAAFMYNFHRIDVNPTQIIVGSCIEQLLYNVLRLHSVNKPYKKEGQGLLSIASQVADGGNIITPTVALSEDPDHTMRHVFMDANIQVKEIPIDEKGLIFNFLVTSGCNLAYVSPTDVPLGDFDEIDDRRDEILSWAKEAPYRYIIELDTDTIKRTNSTFKSHDKADKVIYLNSFKYLLDKGINASWMVLPKKLAAEYTARYTTFDCTLSYLDQVALTDFIIKRKLENYLTSRER